MRLSPRPLALTLIAALLAGLTLLPGVRPAAAGILPNTITVTTTAIENTDGNGCSLYEALQASFNGAPYHQCTAGDGDNLIVFAGSAAGGTITMPTGPSSLDLPMINRNVTITGPVIISGGGAQGDLHIFRIAPGGTLNLTTLTLKDAHTSGGGAAILDTNRGTINALGVAFINNIADGDGGAINSNGTVNIIGSTFSGNQARGLMPDTSNNPATGYGGAIRVDGSDKLKLALTNFSGNLADKGGGAVYYSGNSADVSDTVFSGNLVNGTGSDASAPKGGGAFYADSSATVSFTRSAFSGNLTPTSNGGALYSAISATSVISTTSFNGNIAASPGKSGLGGAIYNAGGTLTIAQALFMGNAVALGNGGALANDRHGSASIANSTFTANAALQGDGGAIYNTNSQQGGPASSVVARNATFSANSAGSGSGHGDALFNAGGHSLSLGNTIVAGGLGENCTGTITSLGHNLESANTCGFNQAGDKHGQDPKLEAPFFNGGPLAALLTHKLKPGSPAIDAGNNAMCAADPVNNIDQRGDPRPKNGDSQGQATCDIGAFESDPTVPGYGSTPVAGGSISFGSAVINGGTAQAQIEIFETGDATLQVSSPQFSGANAGEFSVTAPSPFPLSLADGDPPRNIDLTCAPTGAGTRTATLTLSTNDPNQPQASYALSCVGTTVPKPAFGSQPAAPGPIDLGSAIVGATVNANFTINNTGDGDLHVVAPDPALGGANPADFKLVSSVSPTLTPSASQSLQVQCKPTALGIRTATLTLTTDDPNRATVSFTLTCSGEPAPPPYLDAPGTSYDNNLTVGVAGPYGVAISPDGKNVYVADRGDSFMSAFSRNMMNGQLTFKGGHSGLGALAAPYLVTVSPDGKNVYATGSASNSVVSFLRISGDGSLSYISRVAKGDSYGFCLPNCPFQLDALTGAYQVLISPDGQYAYISDVGDSKIVVLYRNADTGALTMGPISGPVQVYSSANITQAYGMALSPDGGYLYITGYGSDTVEVLKRDAGTGKLTFVERQTNAVNGVDGLDGVFRATVSPDGAYLYTASYDDSAVTVFRRDASTGKLTYLAKYKDGIGGIDGIAACTSVAISPNGAFLFASGYNDNAVTVFERDQVTGLLTQRQVIKRGGNGLPALGGARDIAPSPDGRNIYVTGFTDNKVVQLDVANPTPVAISLAPSSATAGGAVFTLTVNGEGFFAGSFIKWGANILPTSFVNNTQLTASIAADKIGAAGQVNVQVVNLAPGGGASNTLPFTISAPGQNPVPSISTVTPGSAPAGGSAFTLTVNGANFIAGSVVRWNGADRATSFVSSSQLTAQITATDLAAAGPAGVTVFNPGPGGGLSNAAEFAVAGPGENPAPSISSVSPNKQMTDVASASQLTVEISGANFMPDSQAQWNGNNRPTAYVGPTKLRMLVSAADLALGGQGSITVSNPGPGGGASNTATFTIITIKARLFVPLARR